MFQKFTLSHNSIEYSRQEMISGIRNNVSSTCLKFTRHSRNQVLKKPNYRVDIDIDIGRYATNSNY